MLEVSQPINIWGLYRNQPFPPSVQVYCKLKLLNRWTNTDETRQVHYRRITPVQISSKGVYSRELIVLDGCYLCDLTHSSSSNCFRLSLNLFFYNFRVPKHIQLPKRRNKDQVNLESLHYCTKLLHFISEVHTHNVRRILLLKHCY